MFFVSIKSIPNIHTMYFLYKCEITRDLAHVFLHSVSRKNTKIALIIVFSFFTVHEGVRYK